MLPPKTKRTIRRLIPFGLIWLLTGWVFLIVEIAASNSFNELPVTAIKVDFELFIFSSFALIVVGLLSGFIELKYLDSAFINKRFIVRFIYKLTIYTFLFFVVELILFPIAVSLELDVSLFDKQVWMRYAVYFTSFTHLSTFLQLSISLMLSLFYSEISEFIGQKVLINFFTGKYHTPVEEQRIFMFLDMKSSTTIAEQLGNLKYFHLLKAYYRSFTNAIIESEGTIYKYVGDEVIISWEFHRDSRDLSCIDCFFNMRRSLQKRSAYFKHKFGYIPSFKAGIHFGKVTTGEIGVIKKELFFSGDVLNTTARIQSLCNSYGVDILISKELLNELNLNKKYETHSLGDAILKGKLETKELYTLREKVN